MTVFLLALIGLLSLVSLIHAHAAKLWTLYKVSFAIYLMALALAILLAWRLS